METPATLERLDLAYGDLSAAERGEIARQRRVHRETVMFLHEWGHTLGAGHECDDKWIMTPNYSLLESAFSPESVRLMRVGLHHRDACGADAPRRWTSAFRLEARQIAPYAWQCRALEEHLAKAEEVIAQVARDQRSHYVVGVRRAVSRQLVIPAATLATRPKASGAGEITNVKFELHVDAKGHVAETTLIKGSGVELIDRAVADALGKISLPPPPPMLREESGGSVFRFELRLQ